MLSYKGNYLRAVEFRHPEWISCSAGFAPILWKVHRQDLGKIVLDLRL
jgi:hypothetical protein